MFSRDTSSFSPPYNVNWHMCIYTSQKYHTFAQAEAHIKYRGIPFYVKCVSVCRLPVQQIHSQIDHLAHTGGNSKIT